MPLPFPLDRFNPPPITTGAAEIVTADQSALLLHAKAIAEKNYRELDPHNVDKETDEYEYAVPHHLTFTAVWNWHLKYYYSYFDESQIDSIQNSIAMRRDGFIQELLWHRQLPVVCLPFALECDDPDDPGQTEVRRELDKVIRRIPYFQRMKQQLLESLFYGKSGSQTIWGRKKIGERTYNTVIGHMPVNGDKLTYGWDGTPGVFIYNGSSEFNDPRVRKNIEYRDRGPALVLRDPYYRDRFVIHEFQPTDTDYLFESEKAAAVHGLGIRDRFYWNWNMRAQVLDWYLNAIERVGANGMLYAYYTAGNMAQRNAVLKALKDFISTNVAVFPRSLGDKDPVINKIDPSPVGYDVMFQMLEHLENIMRRGILGQSLSSKPGATGMGSGVAELQGESFENIILYDSSCLAECLDEQLVCKILYKNQWFYNGKWMWGKDLPFSVRITLQADRQNVAELVASAKALWDMGVPLDMDDLRDHVGLTPPRSKATTLVQMGGGGVGETPNAAAVDSETGAGSAGDMTQEGGGLSDNNLPALAGKDENNRAPFVTNAPPAPSSPSSFQPNPLKRLLGDTAHKGREHFEAPAPQETKFERLSYQLANFDPTYLRAAFWDAERERAIVSIFLHTPHHELRALRNALGIVLGENKYRVWVEREPEGHRWSRVDLSIFTPESEDIFGENFPGAGPPADPPLLGHYEAAAGHDEFEDECCQHCGVRYEVDKNGKVLLSDHRCYISEPFSEAEHSGEDPGVMIALKIPTVLASDLAVKDGERPEDLHVTLAYLGRVSEIGPENIFKVRELCPILAESWRPLAATVGGMGRFSASESSDGKDVVYASIDSPDVGEFRKDLCDLLEFTKVPYKKNHGFTPHVTLEYIDPKDHPSIKRIEPVPLTFDGLCLVIGGRADQYSFGNS